MSEAPERIWVWWDDGYDVGLVNTHGDKRYTPDDAREYARADRIEQLEEHLASMTGLWAKSDSEKQLLLARIDEFEAKLAKAVEALDEAIYLLDPDEEDMAKKAGVYRIVTTFKELKGQDDE